MQQVDETVMGANLGANRVNASFTPGLRVVEADGNRDLVTGVNHGDPGDPFPGRFLRTRIDDDTRPSMRTFAGAPNNLALESIARSGRDVTLRLRVRAAGWDRASGLADSAEEPVQSPGPGARSAIARDGTAWRISCEPVAGHLRIVLRERGWRQAWRTTDLLDAGTSMVSEPTLAWLGGRDLAIVWVDAASGVGQLVVRTRVSGRWSAPRVLTQSAEGCFAPALAADARGRLHLAWIENIAPRTRLRYMTFLYAAPYGQAVTLTNGIDLPTPPCVTAAGDGRAYVVWPDVGSGTHVIYAARFNPDSGLSARFRLTPNTAAAQTTVSAVVDSAGVLHSVWQVSSGSGSEIHYQRRQPLGRPSQRDTTIDDIGQGLQNPHLALDPTGALHVAYEGTGVNGLELRYKRWRPEAGWDARATTLSDAADVTASMAELLPTSAGDVTAIWTGFDGTRSRLRLRDRRLDSGFVTAVEPTPRPTPPLLRLGPDPLRAGQRLTINAAHLRSGEDVELLDLGGRRMAVTRATTAGVAHLAPELTRTLQPGLYFVRVAGREGAARVVVLR